MSTRKHVARSMMWTALESFGISGLSIIGLIVIARYISPDQLGMAAIALSIVQLLNIPVEFLFVDALIRKKDASEKDFNTAHTVSVCLGILVSLVCWLLSPAIAHAFNAPEIEPILSWMGISVAAMGFGATIIARQRREMKFRALAIRSFFGRLLGVSGAIIIAIMGGGAWSLVAQQVLMVACATLILWLQCERKPSFGYSHQHFLDLFSFGKNTVAIAGLNYSIQRLFMLLVGANLGMVASGYLNLAFRVVDIARDIVTNVVVQLALPMFSRTTDDREKTIAIYQTATSFTCAVTYPLFVGLALCSADLVPIVFGSHWLEAVPYCTLLSLLTLVHFMRLYSNSLLTAQGFPHLPLFPDAGALGVILVGMPLIGLHALPLAASVWTLRIAVSLPIDLFNVRRVTGIGAGQQMQGAFFPAIACAVMAALILLQRHFLLSDTQPILRLACETTSGAVFYVAALWMLDKARIHEIMQFARLALKRH